MSLLWSKVSAKCQEQLHNHCAYSENTFNTIKLGQSTDEIDSLLWFQHASTLPTTIILLGNGTNYTVAELYKVSLRPSKKNMEV